MALNAEVVVWRKVGQAFMIRAVAPMAAQTFHGEVSVPWVDGFFTHDMYLVLAQVVAIGAQVYNWGLGEKEDVVRGMG